jgi:hypothetical protein
VRISLRAMAKRLGVSHTSVEKAVAHGRLAGSVERDRKGRPYVSDPELAVREWADGASRGNGDGGGIQLSLTEAQRSVAIQRAEKLRLENALRTGDLLRRDAVERESFEAARVVRDNVLNVADRIAAQLAGERDARRVHAILTLELRKALEGISEKLGVS